ncbi:MAG: YjbF family lipoprotein [Paracoccus sp. (in: a-proteobacteria)]|uniref:YjbF family lipoprotein n=1 Tax=Paracoccus sp. TaxID=267 RepID=UPI0039E4333B
MIGTRIQGAALTLALVAGLAACGNDNDGGQAANPLLIAAKSLGTAATRIRGNDDKAAAAPARTPEQMAAEAMRVNSGPLILVGFESLGRNQVMAMTGQNGGLRTYMTPAEEALILRDGMVIGTRGLGNDLSVAEPGTENLIRRQGTGQARRVMRYFAGDGLERPLDFNCSVGPGPRAGVVVENCQGHGASFQNNYLPQGGHLPVSRQWLGPKLGYVTIQVLRP